MNFKSTHNLDFEVSDTKSSPYSPEWTGFRIGTCHGLWRSTDKSYEILSVINKEPGNGHFQDVIDWFENSCKRDGRTLVIRETWNTNFRQHLLDQRGFRPVGEFDVEKSFI